MTESGIETSSPGHSLRLAILLVAALLSWLIVRNAVQRAFISDHPAVGAMFWPADGHSLSTIARSRIANNDGAIDDNIRALSKDALRRDPLLADPIMINALAVNADGNAPQALRLMEDARHRDPRSSVVRFWLFDYYLRHALYAEGIEEAGPAMRLRPESTGAILAVLGALADIPPARTALRAKLAQRPFWRVSLFQTAGQDFAQPEKLLGLLQELPRNPDKKAANDEEQATLMAVVARGHDDVAYRVWKSMLPPTFRNQVTAVYDGNFAGWPGAAPFNWRYENDKDGTARPIKLADIPEGSALDVSYNGSNAAILAEQYVKIGPGNYRLNLRVRQRAHGATSGQFKMQARCVDGTLLGDLPLDNLRDQFEPRSVTFTVPDNCAGVRLRLTGDPGEVFSEAEAQLTGVVLTRL